MSVTAASGQEKPVRVLYVAGGARSGSTILGMVLGEIPGFFFAGELIDYWRLWSSRDHRCSCGELLHACSIWSRVSRAGVEGLDQDSARNMVAWARSVRALPRAAVASVKRQKLQTRARERARRRTPSASRASTWRSSAKLAATSSWTRPRNAGYAEFLAAMPEVQLNVVHLVRDPRASAFSWQRRRPTRRARDRASASQNYPMGLAQPRRGAAAVRQLDALLAAPLRGLRGRASRDDERDP